MKKSFMTRVLAMGLSLAMAFSMSAATNVTTASAAASPMGKTSVTMKVGAERKIALTDTAKKKYRIKKAIPTPNAQKYLSVITNDGKKAITITANKKMPKKLQEKGGAKIAVKIYKKGDAKKKVVKTANVYVVVKAKATKPEVVDTSLAIESVTATKVNELTVTFKNAVATSGASVTVTKGSEKVSTASETWAADSKSLVIKTTANMSNGTYTVTVKTADGEDSKTAEVTSQHVAEIQILNKVALTGKEIDLNPTDGSKDENSVAYVYYDVVDQYGESMRNSTTIEWSFSCALHNNNKTEGKLTLKRSDNKAFTYGESIYVTGVHVKSGKTITETLTVGAKQALNSVEVKGFVKKGTSEILQSLPTGFKSQEYYLVYSVKDQNGNKMPAAQYMGSVSGSDAEVTFVSDNILVLKEVTKTGETTLTLGGEEYCAAFVVPGIDVNKGGEVNITAIANKTGNKDNFNVSVGNNQILKSFTLSQPSCTVADGETVKIPFTALDQDGKEITNFVTLANQSDFNKLQLNCSYGFFSLRENNDGTARLEWSDNSDTGKDGDWNSNSEDGIDRPISLTAVVVGGETSNEILYVQDKAMPVAIKSADVNSVYVQRSDAKISLSSFTFIDQYGRVLDDTFGNSGNDGNTGNANKGVIYDNGFFAYANANDLNGTEFKDQKFGVAVEFKGNADNLEQLADDAIATGYDTITTGSIKHISIKDNAASDSGTNPYHFTTGAAFRITSSAGFSVCADQTLKFSIEKIKEDEADLAKSTNISPVVSQTFKGVNIDRVSGFEIKDLNTFFVKTAISDSANAVVYGVTSGGITKSDAISGASIGDNGKSHVATDSALANPYYQEVKVTGKFNGVTVDVPKAYYTVAGGKLGTALVTGTGMTKVSTGAIGANVIDSVAVSDDALKTSDLYDVNSAQYSRKMAEDTLKVTVYKVTSGQGLKVTDTAIVNTATKKVAISDANPYAATICAADAYTIEPVLTVVSNSSIVSPCGLLSTADAKAYNKAYYTDQYWKVLDQYGVEINHNDVAYAYKITDVKENANRYADNNFAVDKNDTADAHIKGAECGDTFVLTISATKGATATKSIKITIASDYWACLDTSGNRYVDTLVNIDGSTGLEQQRIDALGSN